MTIDQVNFGPLEKIQGAWKASVPQIYKNNKLEFVAIVLVMIIGIGLVFVSFNAPFFAILVAAFLIGRVINKIKKLAWREFASVNGWQMDITTPTSMLVPPGLSNVGHSRIYSEVITAQFSDVACDLLTYQYTVGSGKSSVTYYFTLAVVNLGESFPHIILDSRKNNGGIRDIPRGYQEIKLEGDFPNYFKLFINQGEQVDVLSVITPDVMQTLVDSSQKQDIEISGNLLYFVDINDQRNPEAMKALFQSVDKLAAEMVHRAKSLNYQPPIKS